MKVKLQHLLRRGLMQIAVRDDPNAPGYYIFVGKDVPDYLMISSDVKEFSKKVGELVRTYRLEKMSKEEFMYAQRSMSLHSILTTRSRDVYLSVYMEGI